MPWDDPEIAGYVRVPGGRIWYRVNGLNHENRTPIVAITGGPGMSHHYMVPILALADERPVVLYDQLDTGNADRPNDPKNWELPRFLAEIDALRDALRLSDVVLLGHSWGAVVALDYALSKPAGLKALVLASPLVSVTRWLQDTAKLVAEMPEDLREVIADCEARGDFDNPEFNRAIREFGLRHVCRTDPRPDFVLKSFSMFGSPIYNAIWGPSEFSARGSLKTHERADRLGELSLPILFTCGEHDEATPAACREFADRIPSASLVVIDDASHFTFAERPEAYVEAIRPFLVRADSST
jgi:proline-specific peptidase